MQISQSIPKGLIFFGLLLVATGNLHAAVVFSDNFSGGSTVPITTAPNNSYPSTTATSTGYAIVSAKNQAIGTPTIAPGHLVFGMDAQTGAIEQAQALFATTPITLTNTNDFIEFTITFNATGILTSTSSTSAELDFGLFNSGGSAPKTDLSASGLGTSTTDATGGTAGWQGYTMRIFSVGGSSTKVTTRPAQTGPDNTNQELLTSGASGSTSYHNPAGTTIGSTSSGANVTLTNGQYTEDLVITLTGASQESIVNKLYTGAAVAGTPISTFSKTASGANFLTGDFDGMAFGWRETVPSGNPGVASSMDVNSITVSSNVSATLPLLGDVDGNNVVNVADVQAMMTALSDLNDYTGVKSVLDVDQSGSINSQDIQALIVKIANATPGGGMGGGSLAAVPEPASLVLLSLGGIGLGMFAQRRRRTIDV